MAILANKSGLIIAVEKTAKQNVWLARTPKGSCFRVKPDEINRKIFEGENAFDDAVSWIKQQRSNKTAKRQGGE